jgi:carbamoyltransferase
MTAILGLSAFHPDSAAALVCDGEIVAAAQEERFSRIPHDASFPAQAAAYCLREVGLKATDLDFIAFFEKPRARVGRLLKTCLALAPQGVRSFAEALPAWLVEKLFLRRRVRRCIGGRGPILFLDRHESLAAGAFFASPFDEAAVLTLDGPGGWTATACGIGRGNRLELTHHFTFPHSLGLLYSAFVHYCGEPKLMGLAPYGRPIYRDLIIRRLMDLCPDGSFALDMRYFAYYRGQVRTTRRFERLFGAPPRLPEAPILQRYMDLAASVQAVIEEVLLRLGNDLHRRTGMRQLALAGSMAHNAAANGRLLREGPFASVWIQPDTSGALGAALFVWHQLLDRPRQPGGGDAQRGSMLGPAFDSRDVLRALAEAELPHQHFTNEDELLREVAVALADGKVVGWLNGRMELGPWVLGGRSILGDPRSAQMQAALHRKTVFRDGYQPFTAAVLAEHAQEWFDLPAGQESPYALLTAPVRPCHRRALSDAAAVTMAGDPDLVRRVCVVRSAIPAVTHVDYTAVVQTVDASRNPRFHRLLRRFHRLTGCPLLAQADLRAPGEPLVCTPQEALRCFLATDVDLLVVQDVLVSRHALDVGRRVAGQRQEHLTGLRRE